MTNEDQTKATAVILSTPFYCTTSQLKPSPIAGGWFYGPTPKLAVIAPFISSKDSSSWAEVLKVGISSNARGGEVSLHSPSLLASRASAPTASYSILQDAPRQLEGGSLTVLDPIYQLSNYLSLTLRCLDL